MAGVIPCPPLLHSVEVKERIGNDVELCRSGFNSAKGLNFRVTEISLAKIHLPTKAVPPASFDSSESFLKHIRPAAVRPAGLSDIR